MKGYDFTFWFLTYMHLVDSNPDPLMKNTTFQIQVLINDLKTNQNNFE